MKLKQLKKKAKKLGAKWIAVDKSRCAFTFAEEPQLSSSFNGWDQSADGTALYMGMYTGKKHWKKTLREVK